jgi:Lipase (class 3)
MRNRTLSVIAAALLATGIAGGLSACSSSGSSTSATGLARTDVSKYDYTGEVYLLRGLANVFSTGLDQINSKFRVRGVNSRVDNHAVWETWARDIVERSKNDKVSYPIVIMGHSLGGNASVQMAKYLGDRGVPVSYVVAFDPTITTFVGPNVTEVVNYYLPNHQGGNETNIVKEEPGSKAQVANIDSRPTGVDHFNIEKNPELQVRVITKTMSLLKPRYTGEPLRQNNN